MDHQQAGSIRLDTLAEQGLHLHVASFLPSLRDLLHAAATCRSLLGPYSAAVAKIRLRINAAPKQLPRWCDMGVALLQRLTHLRELWVETRHAARCLEVRVCVYVCV